MQRILLKVSDIHTINIPGLKNFLLHNDINSVKIQKEEINDKEYIVIFTDVVERVYDILDGTSVGDSVIECYLQECNKNDECDNYNDENEEYNNHNTNTTINAKTKKKIRNKQRKLKIKEEIKQRITKKENNQFIFNMNDKRFDIVRNEDRYKIEKKR